MKSSTPSYKDKDKDMALIVTMPEFKDLCKNEDAMRMLLLHTSGVERGGKRRKTSKDKEGQGEKCTSAMGRVRWYESALHSSIPGSAHFANIPH